MAFARNLRYSPVNWLVVDWGQGGRAFNDCGLPTPEPCTNPAHSCDTVCTALIPIQEAINTYDWERWLPEVIVGIEDPDEDIAANYVRQAAIEFAEKARVLQREIIIELQPDVNTYPVFPYVGERIVGVLGIQTRDQCCGSSATNCCSGWIDGMDWELDTARNEFTISGPTRGTISLLVWSAPTEDACAHDVYLYDNFRRDITTGARNAYANAVHFRDRLLMASLAPSDTFQRAMLLAKTKAVMRPSAAKMQPGTLFGRDGCCFRRAGAGIRHRR